MTAKERYLFDRERFMTIELLLDCINTYLVIMNTRKKFADANASTVDIKKLDRLEANLWKNISNSIQSED